MSPRRTEGDETWARLRDWTKGQKTSERLSAQILMIEGFSSVDPSHPLGGPDGLKDMICKYDNLLWIGSSYFPRGKKEFRDIKEKFNNDLKGVKANKTNGIVFLSNQELVLSERKELKKLAEKSKSRLELFHLERIARILDSPECYGIRLEFLDMEMTKEEQLAFIKQRDLFFENLKIKIDNILDKSEDKKGIEMVPLKEIREFRNILDSIAGRSPYMPIQSEFSGRGHIDDLRVPIGQMREFENILIRVVGSKIPSYSNNIAYNIMPTLKDLYVPLEGIKEYEEIVDRILHKLKQIKTKQKEMKVEKKK